jgi:hypothetical protein
MGTVSCEVACLARLEKAGKHPGSPGGVIVLDVVQNFMTDNTHQVLEAQRWQSWQQAPHDFLCSHCIDALQYRIYISITPIYIYMPRKITKFLSSQAWAQQQSGTSRHGFHTRYSTRTSTP